MKIYRDLKNLPKFKNAVVTIGSFDGLHTGHRKIMTHISELANECDGESVVISFHPHPRQVVYPNDDSLRLLNSVDEKIYLFEKSNIDHLVLAPFSIEFSQISPQEYIENFLIKNFNPRYIVIGYDHKFGLNRQGDIHTLRQYETNELEIIEIEEQEIDDLGISSTKIRKSIASGYMVKANKLLGHPYILKGKVVHGQKLGHTIGYPTANIEPQLKSKLIPSEGIYAVRIDVEGLLYDGMLYIGTKPTVDSELKQVIEVNIFDFNQTIYGHEIIVHFIEFVREDQKYDSVAMLQIALGQDKERVENILEAYTTQNEAKSTIAILNYNGVEYLEAYLADVEFSTKDETKVLVIDNNSTDNSVSYIKDWHPGVRINKLTKNYGFAGGYNLGLKQVNTPYTVILNSDVKVTENWIDPLIKILDNNPHIACIQPKIKSLETPSHFEYAGAAGGYLDKWGYPFCRGRIFDAVEKDEGQYNDEREIFWASGAAMIIRTNLFKKLGGFDESFFAHMEEIDLCWRIKRAGYKIMYSPKATVYHLGGGTLAYESSQKVFLNFRNNLALLIKNEKGSKLLWEFPLRLILDGIAGLKFLFGGNISSCLSIIKAHFATYGNLFQLLKKRRELKRKLTDLSIGKENNAGRYKGSIVFQYFLFGKKKFSELK